MTLRTPQTGDRASAAEDRLIIRQLQDSQTRDLRVTRPPPYSERLLVGEIIAVLTGAGVPRYSWKLLYCDGSTVDPTWVDSLMRGTNETYPYLFEVNRAAGDPPSYKAGDRVLVHVVFSASGVSYVVDSLARAGVEGLGGIALAMDKTIDINLADDNQHIYTLDTRDWRGRHIWIAGLSHVGAPGANANNCFYREWTGANGPHGATGFVQPEALYHDMAGPFWIYTMLAVADGDALTAQVLIDGPGGGVLKLDVCDADGDRTQVWIRATAGPAKVEDTPDIAAPD